MTDADPLIARLERIAAALERLAPPAGRALDLDVAEAYVWQSAPPGFLPVERVNRMPMALLKGIDHTRDLLHDNTERFARGLPANNALLWGARGMGKSSLVKAVHADVRATLAAGLAAAPAEAADLKLVEIHREDIKDLPHCLSHLRISRHRFIVFCDDLSFDTDDTSYKSLKAVLEGGIEGRPANVLFYATSNRRHLMPRDMMENERSTAINPSEAVEEKVSLSDRFGLWLGFHNCSQADFFAMIRGYVRHYGLEIADADLEREAREWQVTRGSRSGRVAWQFVQDLAGRLGQRLD
ncbi:MAG: ATP-binding protein [Hyphomicrobiaceae bacterium]